MTKKLEDLFDLADLPFADEGESEVEIVGTEMEISTQQLRELDTTLERIDAALPTVRDINTSDADLDRLSKMAEDGFNDLLELGMNVEPMRGGEILSTASSLLGHAIAAKNAKVNNKLKIVQLQIQKARLDLQRLKANEDDAPLDGDSRLLDRNSILAAILKEKK